MTTDGRTVRRFWLSAIARPSGWDNWYCTTIVHGGLKSVDQFEIFLKICRKKTQVWLFSKTREFWNINRVCSKHLNIILHSLIHMFHCTNTIVLLHKNTTPTNYIGEIIESVLNYITLTLRYYSTIEPST